MLNTLVNGTATDRPPLLIVHGLFGSARNWNVIARRLATDRLVLSVDERNHGDSPWAAPHDYPAMAGDLAEVIAAHGGRADVIGHSMGGKAAMCLALTQPERVGRLIVADIAPVGYGHTQTPLIHAMRDLDLAGVSTRGEADRRLALTVPEPEVRAFLLQSLDLKAEPPRWKLNLDQLEADMADIIGFPAVDATFEGPTLFLRGAASGYVRPEMEPRIHALFPAARIECIEGAGHWLHAEKPREFEAAAAAFLNRAGN